MTRTHVTRTLAYTVVALLAFAGNSILCRMALAEDAIDPLSFTGLRLLGGAVVLLPFVRGEGRSDLRGALALVGYAVGFSLAYVSLDTGTGALLLFGAVQATMIGAGLWRGERPNATRVVGIVAALLGLVILVSPGVTSPPLGGAALMAGAGIAWGCYSLLGRGVTTPTRMTARNFLLAVPVAAALLGLGDPTNATSTGIALALVSGAVTSGLGYAVWYAALPGHSATSAAIVQLAVPILAAFGGIVLLDETLTLRLAGCGVLTLAGIGVALRSSR